MKELPEEISRTRHLTSVKASRFPWLDPNRQDVHLSEVSFQENTVAIIASAGSVAMNAITKETCRNKNTPQAYSTADHLFLRAVRAQADGIANNRLSPVDGTRDKEDFRDYQVLYMRQCETPNALRVYLAVAKAGLILSQRELNNLNVNEKSPLCIRLCIADKNRKNQMKLMQLLTKNKQKRLRVHMR